MKVVVLYRPNSEFSRGVEEYLREFEHRTNKKLELLDVDSPEGSRTAELYGVVDYPTLLALANDGQLQKSWSGPLLPLINEVSAYVVEE